MAHAKLPYSNSCHIFHTGGVSSKLQIHSCQHSIFTLAAAALQPCTCRYIYICIYMCIYTYMCTLYMHNYEATWGICYHCMVTTKLHKLIYTCTCTLYITMFYIHLLNSAYTCICKGVLDSAPLSCLIGSVNRTQSK